MATTEKLFIVCNDLNQLAHTTLSELRIHSEDHQKIIASSLFVRLLSQYQSVIILIERGMINEVKIILRAMLDGIFVLVAVAKDEKYMKYYINDDDDIEKRIAFLKRFSENIDNHFDDIQKQLTEENISEQLKELKAERKHLELNELKLKGMVSTKKWAEFAQMEELYYRLYSQFNYSVHGLSRELEQYITAKDDGEVTGMNWGPDVEGIDIVLTTTADFLCRVLSSINNLFGLNNSKVEDSWKVINQSKISSDDMKIKSEK